MTAGTRYIAPPNDYHSRTAELLDPPWIDVITFVVYPPLLFLLLFAALVFAFIRRRRARTHANG